MRDIHSSKSVIERYQIFARWLNIQLRNLCKFCFIYSQENIRVEMNHLFQKFAEKKSFNEISDLKTEKDIISHSGLSTNIKYTCVMYGWIYLSTDVMNFLTNKFLILHELLVFLSTLHSSSDDANKHQQQLYLLWLMIRYIY